MNIREISIEDFRMFSKQHILKNFYQSVEYGSLMKTQGYNSIYIGGFINSNLVCASLILSKSIGPNMKYGYAPRGFLIDYYDTNIVKAFTKKVKDYFLMKGYAFIKINPEITNSILDFNTKTKILNTKNQPIIDLLKKSGYDKLKDNLYFESMLPKFNPIIYLPQYNIDKLDQNILENMKNYSIKGISIKSGTKDDIETLYSFISKKTDKTVEYYKNMFEIFEKSNMIDLMLIELKYDTYVKFLQKQYNVEAEKNDLINIEFNNNPTNNDIYNKKMESDKLINDISVEISLLNKRMQEDQNSEILGGALIVKYEGRVTLLISGQKNDFNGIDVKTFIFYKIIEEYKKANYLYLDLNGITGDMSNDNPYKDVNDFKLKFNPTTFEYIGEFDLIVNKPFHQILWSSNKIQKEFYKAPRKSQ